MATASESCGARDSNDTETEEAVHLEAGQSGAAAGPAAMADSQPALDANSLEAEAALEAEAEAEAEPEVEADSESKTRATGDGDTAADAAGSDQQREKYVAAFN